MAAVTDRLRAAGALDVTLCVRDDEAGAAGHAGRGAVSAGGRVRELEALLFAETTTIGVRQRSVRRRALPREMVELTVLGHDGCGEARHAAERRAAREAGVRRC